MAVHVLPVAQPEVPFRLHAEWQVVLAEVMTHTDPGRQSSGKVEHFSPTFLSCSELQSQTVLSVFATPVSPARNTQLRVGRAIPQPALPVGLQVSTGGEHKKTLFTAWPPTTMVLALQ